MDTLHTEIDDLCCLEMMHIIPMYQYGALDCKVGISDELQKFSILVSCPQVLYYLIEQSIM